MLMHITTLCPECDSRFQVESDLLGKKMRCPNPKCRKIFEVKDAAQPKPAAGRRSATLEPDPRSSGITSDTSRRWSGSVGDIVPVLPAEEATPSDPIPILEQVSDDIPLIPIDDL